MLYNALLCRDRQILIGIVFVRVRFEVRTHVKNNGNAPRHLTRQTTCVSHRKPAIDQITPLACMQTDCSLDIYEGLSPCERQGHGYASTKASPVSNMRLRIAFPYWVTALVHLSRSVLRSGFLSLIGLASI